MSCFVSGSCVNGTDFAGVSGRKEFILFFSPFAAIVDSIKQTEQ